MLERVLTLMEQVDMAGAFGGGEEEAAAWAAVAAAWEAGLAGGMEDPAMLPFWSEADELLDHRSTMFAFNAEHCEDFQNGTCSFHRGKGKTSPCFCYHFDFEYRRPPIDSSTGRLLYWDIPCSSTTSEVPCPHGHLCVYAHSLDEISYHPAKYKTRLCNGRNCRGLATCCFAHGVEELRSWAQERYSCATNNPGLWKAAPGAASAEANLGSSAFSSRAGASAGAAAAIVAPSFRPKQRFCASFPDIGQCRRGSACAFAHSREEICTPLLSKEEEQQEQSALTEIFFMYSFKTLWCPIGVQHDWQTCVYAHNYQDARRKVSIGYGPRPCPYWAKKDTGADYSSRCPFGLRCPYSHGAKEQLYHPMYFRTVICRDLRAKACPRQKLCAFFHRRAERRRPPNDATNYEAPLPEEGLPETWVNDFLTPPFQEASAGMGSRVAATYEEHALTAADEGHAGGAFWCGDPLGFGFRAGHGMSAEDENEEFAAALQEQAHFNKILQASFADYYMRMLDPFSAKAYSAGQSGHASYSRKPSGDSDPADETSTIDSVTAAELAFFGCGSGGSSTGNSVGRSLGQGAGAMASSSLPAYGSKKGGRRDMDMPMKVPFSGGPFSGPFSAFPGFMANNAATVEPSQHSLLGVDLETLL